MPDEKDSDAAAARAVRLREQISGIVSGSAEATSATRDDAAKSPDATPPLSPREFVQKRMRELDPKT